MAKIFVDKLVNLDFTYFDAQRGLVGETLLVDFTLAGTQDDQGMVLDFALVKRQVVSALESAVDHKLVLAYPQTASHITISPDSEHPGNSKIHLQDVQHQYILSLPAAGYSALPITEISPSTLAEYLTEYLQNQPWWQAKWTPTLALYPEPMAPDTPFFQYTHGLPKHAGACQRIAHGHRSKLLVYQNDTFDKTQTDNWCTQWRDIYIANQLDLVAETDRQGTRYYQFAYRSAEGYFALEMPASRAYIIPTETTIENIAQYVADQTLMHIQYNMTLTEQPPSTNKHVQISTKVYEGYNKGAIGRATLT